MGDITKLTEINFLGWIITGFMLMAALIAMYTIVCKFFEIIGKPIGILKQRKIDHELILQNAKAIQELSMRHTKDTEESIKHDAKIENELRTFMDDMKSEIRQFADNRVHDREQSFEIQKNLTDSIKVLAEANSLNSGQIDNLMVAQREVLADRINAKYKHYISINGIPEDEVDEFVNLHAAYKGCGGNSSGDAKFDYCINHLPVIPVETKLVIKHNS